MSEAGGGATTGPLVVGRYALFDEIASGGMATVHLGRDLSPLGRTVAIKRLRAHYLQDEEFVAMFMDEARLVARIPPHPNVVPMVDLVRADEGLFLAIEYVHGESLSRLLRDVRKANERIPLPIVGSIVSGVLHGLHAAHETRSRDGTLLNVVHRDVSPQNIMVGADGVARVLDFGIAKAVGRAQTTREGQIKGKLAYMAPEQIRGKVDRRTDVFSAAIVLWEMLAGRRVYGKANDVDIVSMLIRGTVEPPSAFAADLSPAIDAMVMKGIASDLTSRYATARDLALDVEKHLGLASTNEVSDWLGRWAKDVLVARAALVAAMEEAAEDLAADEFVVVEETSRRAPLSLPRLPPATGHSAPVAEGAPPAPAAPPGAPIAQAAAEREELEELEELDVVEELEGGENVVPVATERPRIAPVVAEPAAPARRVAAVSLLTPPTSDEVSSPPPPPPPPSPLRIAKEAWARLRIAKEAWVAVAVLVTLAALGAGLGVCALSRRSDERTERMDTADPPPSSSTTPTAPPSILVEHPVAPPPPPTSTSTLAAPPPPRPSSATPTAEQSPPSFAAGPSMIPTPLARPSPTP